MNSILRLPIWDEGINDPPLDLYPVMHVALRDSHCFAFVRVLSLGRVFAAFDRTAPRMRWNDLAPVTCQRTSERVDVTYAIIIVNERAISARRSQC